MRSSINNEILNKMRNESYTKEGVYAQLIINVLDESNKFSRKLSNVYVNHNIIEMILLDETLCFLHYEFGRDKDEFCPKFIKACEALNKQFNKDYPNANDYTGDYKKNYYKKSFFGVRIFMRKINSKITFPLQINSKVKSYFVSLDNSEEQGEICLSISWYKGKRYGHNFLNEDYSIDRKLTKSEILKLQTEIELIANLNHEGCIDYDVVQEIIDNFLISQNQKSELNQKTNLTSIYC